MWIGIDGLGSPDVLQSGIEVVYHSASKDPGAYVTTSAYAWVEWFPYPEVQIDMQIEMDDVLNFAVIYDRDIDIIYITNISTNQQVILKSVFFA